MAQDAPVFPDDAQTTVVWPATRRPFFSALVIMLRMMRSLCCGGGQRGGTGKRMRVVVSGGGAVEADIDHIRNFSYREPRCRKVAAADAAMIRRGSARRRRRRGWTNRDGQTVSGRHGGRSWGKARVRGQEGWAGGWGSGTRNSGVRPRERGTLQCTALTICKLGLAEDTGPGVLGICERSEVEQRGLADEVLGPREADRAVGQRRVVRRAGCPRTKCF